MKKILNYGFLFVLALMSLVLVSCDSVSAQDVVNKVIIEQEEGYVDKAFYVIGQVKHNEETYEVKWTSDNDALKVSDSKNTDGYYTISVVRPEDEMQEVKLTATVEISKDNKASKTFNFTVYPVDVYDFLGEFEFEYKDAQVDMGTTVDLPTSVAFADKTATVSWATEDTDYVTINAEGNKATFSIVEKDVDVVLMATVTYKDESAPVECPVTITPYKTEFEKLKYWYDNHGIVQKLSGYIVEIFEEHSSYNNVSLYIINDDFTGGHYLYRVACDADNGQKIKLGAHVTVVGALNSNYNGLIETAGSSSGTLTVDTDVTPIDVNSKVYAMDDDFLANAPSLYYRLSTVVSLTNWKVKSIKVKGEDGKVQIDDGKSSALEIMTLEKDGVEIQIRYSNYILATKMPNRNNGEENDVYKAVTAKLESINVGDYVDVSGILSYYNTDGEGYDQKSYQILVQNGDSIVKNANGSDVTGSECKGLQAAMAEVGFAPIYTTNQTIQLPAESGDAIITWKFHNPYHVGATLGEDGYTLTIAPEKYSKVSMDATYTIGEYSTVVYYSFIVEYLTDEQIVDRVLEEIVIADQYAPKDTELPTTHELYEGVTVSYALKEASDYATIENNVLTINNRELAEETKVIIVATAKKGETVTDTREIEVTIHKLEVISIADFIAAKDPYTPKLLQGVITAVNKTSGITAFVLTDAAGDSIFSYQGAEVVLGEEVKVLGVYDDNNGSGFHQIGSKAIKPEIIERVATHEDVAAKSGTVVEVPAETLKEDLSLTNAKLIEKYAGKYLKITGYLEKSGTYFGVDTTYDTSTSYIVNLYANNGIDLASLEGQEVIVYGFCRGVKSGANITVQVQSAEAIPLTNPQDIVNFEAGMVSLNSSYKSGTYDLPGTTAYNDVVLSYEVTEGAAYAAISEGKLVLTADSGADQTVKVTVTATLGEKTATKELTFTVKVDTYSSSAMATNPQADVEYDLVIDQAGLGKQLYFNGQVASQYYGGTTEDETKSVKVTLVAVTGGYNIKYTVSGAIKYINITVSGDHKNFTMDDAAKTVWTWDETYNTLVADVNGTKCYAGTYGTYSTFSISTYDKITEPTSYPAHLYEGVVYTKDEYHAIENAKYLEGLYKGATLTEETVLTVTLPHAATLTAEVASGAKTLVWDATANTLTVTPELEELTEKVTFTVTVGAHTKTVEWNVTSMGQIVPATHAEYYAAATGAQLYVQGVVTSKKTDNKSYWVKDNDGCSYQIYLAAADSSIKVGDEVLFLGAIAEFRGNRQLGSAAKVEVISSNNPVSATDITADVTSNGFAVTNDNHGSYVVVEGVVKSSDGTNIVLTVGSNEVSAYNNSKVTLPSYFVVGARVKVAGTLGYNNGASQFNINALSDIQEGQMTDAEKVAFDLSAIEATMIVTDSITLPATGKKSSTLSWAVAEGTAIAYVEGAWVVTQPAAGEENATVVLVVTATLNDATADKEVTVTVKALPSADVTYTDSTYSHTFQKNELNSGTVKLTNVDWVISFTGSTYFGWDSNATAKGIQFGSSGSPMQTFKLTSSEFTNVKKVTVNTSGASGVKGSFTVSVNGIQIGNAITLTTTATDYTFTLDVPVTGEVEISYTNSAKAMYIKSITVEYQKVNE